MGGKREIGVRGRKVSVPTVPVGDVDVVVRGKLVKTAEVFDEYWLERSTLPPLDVAIEQLRSARSRIDIFTFAQRAPDSTPGYQGYTMSWGNLAALPLTTWESWFERQIPSATRRAVRASEKRGVTVRVCAYDDAYVEGIRAIYDETPIRAGRRYWHYGKDLETVRQENGTYAERSTFLGAFVAEEMVGYLKVVWDARTAAIMQIVSKTSARDQRVNNALMSEAVRQACARGSEYLLYESFDYGKKTGDSLTRFKQSNGFQRMDIPRYHVPLTTAGALALRLGLHRSIKERIPERLAARWRALRSRWYERGQTVAEA